MSSLVKYNGIFIDKNKYQHIQRSIDPNKLYLSDGTYNHSSNQHPEIFYVCLLGDGAVENGEIRKALEEKVGTGYFEKILAQAYSHRRISDIVKFYQKAQFTFKQIINGIQIILDCGIYNFSEEEKTQTYLNVGFEGKIHCDPNWHNQECLEQYKEIITETLNHINYIIDVYDNKINPDEIILDNSVILAWFSSLSLPLISGRSDAPLDLSSQLNKYHNLPTGYISEFVNSFEIHHHIHETFQEINKYNQYITELAGLINNINSNLRTRPEVIDDINNTWFLSLNWCNSDTSNTEIKNLIKLHGSCVNPSSMILPTQEFRDSRVLSNDSRQSDSINLAYVLLQKCSKLYIWGCSLSDYDVEVHHLIFSAIKINKKLQEVIIINPDDSVINRVEKIMQNYGINHISVTHINPKQE